MGDTLEIDEFDMVWILAAFTRCEHGPKDFPDMQDAVLRCSPEVRAGYLREGKRILAALREGKTSGELNPARSLPRRIEPSYVHDSKDCPLGRIGCQGCR